MTGAKLASASSRRLLFAGTLVMAAIALCWWSYRSLGSDAGPEHGSITVVAGRGGSQIRAEEWSLDDNAQRKDLLPQASSLSLPAIVAERYPMVKDVRFDCTPEGCALSGTVSASTTDQDKDARQAMLLGGLEQLMTASGHPPTAAIQMDEVGDGEFRLRVSARQVPTLH